MAGLDTERQISTLTVIVVFYCLATTAIAFRYISRHIQKLRPSTSDWVMFAAWPVITVNLVANIIGIVQGGLGRHQIDLSIEEITLYLKSIYAIQLTWAGTLGLVKTSICLLYIGLFPLRKVKIAAYILIAFCNSFALVVILGTILICTPVQSSYDPTITQHCGNRVDMWVAIGALNITTDLLVVALPLPILWDLKLPTRKKVGLCLLFGLGFFVCIVSGIRLKFLLDVKFDGDASYQISLADVWSFLELTLAMTVGCIPTLRPVFLLFTGRRLDSSQGTTNTSGRGKRGYGRSGRQTWRRMSNQSIPLTNVTAVTANPITDQPGKTKDADSLQSINDAQYGVGPLDRIAVTRQWEVNTTDKIDH